MITRVIQGKRPRTSALLLMGGAVLAAGLIAAMALALVSDSGTCDVTVATKDDSGGPCALTPGVPGDPSALVEYIGSSADNQSSGTGIFDPFVRLQADTTEKGYNTDGAVAFNTKAGKWTHAILVNAIPIVDCDGADGPGTALCWELFVDINENNTAKRVSLNDVEIWFTTNQNLVGYQDPGGFPSGATKEYDFSGNILINDVNQGSGRGDLRYLVPIANIDPWNSSTYFVLYSKWGTTSGTAGNFGTGAYTSDGGFEEWKVRKVTVLQPTLTTSATGAAIGSSISDSATLAGASPSAGGTITFTAFGPEASATCAAADLVFTSAPVAVSGDGTYGPVSFTPSIAGDYYWVASYSGDLLANTLPASTACGDTGEKSTVTPNAPVPHSTPVVNIKDTFSVTGFAAPAAGAPTVHVGLYTSSDCTTGQQGSDATFAVPAAGDTLTGATSFVAVLAGDYYYKISYAGDANNSSFSSCVEHVGVTITSLA